MQNALLYFGNNLNHLIKHTHRHACTHTYTHVHTVSMETETRAFYDWLFAQDNQKWSRQPCKDGRYIICIMSNGTYTNEENKMCVVAWRSLVTKFDHEIVIEYKLSIKPSFSVCLGWRQTSRLSFFLLCSQTCMWYVWTGVELPLTWTVSVITTHRHRFGSKHTHIWTLSPHAAL